MSELLTGYNEHPAFDRKGPRIKREAHENYKKNKGTFNTILDHSSNKDDQPVRPAPKVKYEGMENRNTGAGTVSSLFSNYGYHAPSARPVPRVKFDGTDNLLNNNGSDASKTLQMVPPSARPSSTIFFQPR